VPHRTSQTLGNITEWILNDGPSLVLVGAEDDENERSVDLLRAHKESKRLPAVWYIVASFPMASLRPQYPVHSQLETAPVSSHSRPPAPRSWTGRGKPTLGLSLNENTEMGRLTVCFWIYTMAASGTFSETGFRSHILPVALVSRMRSAHHQTQLKNLNG